MTGIDDRQLRARLDRLSRAVPVRAEQGTGPVVRVRPRARANAGAGALAAAAILVLVLAVGFGSGAVRPSTVVDVASDGRFSLTLRVEGDHFTPADAISATATLEFTGPEPSIEVHSHPSLVGFGVEEVGGTRRADPAYLLSLVAHTLDRGRPVTYPFVKSGGFAPGDADADFVARYLNITDGRADPILRLPPGTWRIFAEADFAGLRADVTVTVAGSDWTAGPRPSSPPQSASDAPTPLPTASPESTRDPRYVRVDTLTIAADRRHVKLTFVGGAPYAPADPCTVDYTAAAEAIDGVLEVGVTAVPHPDPTLAPNEGCDLVGHPRTLDVVLDEPFTGARWHDRAGYLHFLAPPQGLVELTTLPAGWRLRSERDVENSPTGRWERTYAPDPDSTGDQTLVLYQSFGGPVGVTGGDGVGTAVTVNGQPARLYRWDPAGELVLVWQVGDSGLALVGYEPAFSVDALIRLAETSRASGE